MELHYEKQELAAYSLLEMGYVFQTPLSVSVLKLYKIND